MEEGQTPGWPLGCPPLGCGWDRKESLDEHSLDTCQASIPAPSPHRRSQQHVLHVRYGGERRWGRRASRMPTSAGFPRFQEEGEKRVGLEGLSVFCLEPCFLSPGCQ